jgi:hypothetical protein
MKAVKKSGDVCGVYGALVGNPAKFMNWELAPMSIELDIRVMVRTASVLELWVSLAELVSNHLIICEARHSLIWIMENKNNRNVDCQNPPENPRNEPYKRARPNR